MNKTLAQMATFQKFGAAFQNFRGSYCAKRATEFLSGATKFLINAMTLIHYDTVSFGILLQIKPTTGR